MWMWTVEVSLLESRLARTMPRAIALSLWIIPIVLALGAGGAAQGGPPDPRAEVEKYLTAVKFTPAELATLQTGKVVAHAEPGTDSRELLAIAAVKIRAPLDPVVAYYGQMVAYVDGKVTLGFGKFSTPAVASDVARLAFDRNEASDLLNCRPGSCDIRIGGSAISAIQSSVDRAAPDAADRINGLIRKTAVDYVTAYRARGNAALITFNDRDQPVSLGTEWSGILASSSNLHSFLPEVARYLDRYPSEPLPGGRDVFYWIKENYGLKPVVSIVHGVIYTPPAQPNRTVVAQKYLYASHYYDASLAVASILTGTENGAPVTYLLYGNRSRGDMLKGGFGGIRRSAAQSQARKAAENTLTTIKDVVEKSAAR